MNKQYCVLLLVALLVGSAFGQDDWHTYPFRDLASVINGEQALYNSSGKADMIVSAKPFPSKTRVVYTGERRPVSEIGISFMKIWAESRNVPAKNVDQLLEEFLFLEKGREYWMPVQKGTAQAIAENVKKGEEVNIYYFYLGGFNARRLHSKHEALKKLENREADGIRWLFAVERVERLGSAFPLLLIEDVIQKNRPSAIAGSWIAAEQIKAKVKAEFRAKFRDVSGKRGEVRDSWFVKEGAPGAARLMQTEGLFKIEDREYWIVLRDRTRQHLSEYVKKGDTVFLNTILAGGIEKPEGVDWVFMSGEYTTF